MRKGQWLVQQTTSGLSLKVNCFQGHSFLLSLNYLFAEMGFGIIATLAPLRVFVSGEPLIALQAKPSSFGLYVVF